MTNTKFNQSQEMLESMVNSVIQSAKSTDLTKELTELVISEGSKAIAASRKMRQEVAAAFSATQDFPEYDHNTGSIRQNTKVYLNDLMGHIMVDVMHPIEDIMNESNYEKFNKSEEFLKNEETVFSSLKTIQEALLKESTGEPVVPMEHVITAADLINNKDLEEFGVKEGDKVMLVDPFSKGPESETK